MEMIEIVKALVLIQELSVFYIHTVKVSVSKILPAIYVHKPYKIKMYANLTFVKKNRCEIL